MPHLVAIVQGGNHRIDSLGVSHARAGAHRREHIGRTRHDFNATADPVITVTEHDVLCRTDDALQAGRTKAANLHSDRVHRQTGLN